MSQQTTPLQTFALADTQQLPENSRPRRHKLRYALLVLTGLTLLGGAAYAYFALQNKTDLKKIIYQADNRICTVRWEKLLYCSNLAGKDAMRYDFPDLGGSLTSIALAPDRTHFVVLRNDIDGMQKMTLLNETFGKERELTLPQDRIALQVVFEHNGDSLLIAAGVLDKSKGYDVAEEQVYRYDLSSNTLTQLTHLSGDYNLVLVGALNDGSIVFTKDIPVRNSSDKKSLYAMDRNGQGVRIVSLPIHKDYGSLLAVSYDPTNGSLFVLGAGNDPNKLDEKRVWRGTVKELEANKAPSFALPGDVYDFTSAFTVSDDKALLQSTDKSYIVQLSTGKVLETVQNQPGLFVGIVPAASLTESNPQAEPAYSRLINLDRTPADFQEYIKKEFDALDGKCDPGALEMVIDRVSGSYVRVAKHCDTGAMYYYAKLDGVWQEIGATQDILTCDFMNKYKIPKGLESECFDVAANKPVANPNN